MSYQDQTDAIKNKASNVANDVSDRASSAFDKASRQASDAKRQVVNTASDYASRAADALNDYGVDTDNLGRAISTSADSISKSLRSLVRDRPLGALAITAAIGLIIGAWSSK